MTTMLIAVVVPDPKLAAEMAAALTGAHQVEICHTARAAMDLIDRVVPDVVIAHTVLPDANGLELCARLKADRHTEEVKTIVVSGFRRAAGFVEEARAKFGIDGYLEQPISAAEARDAVDAVLKKKTFCQGTPPRVASTEPAAEPNGLNFDTLEWDSPSQTVETAAEDDFEAEIRAALSESPPEPRTVAAAAPRVTEPGPPEPPHGSPNQEPDETGRIGPTLLPELLLQYYRAHANGVLDVRSRGEHREILLRDGVPTMIRTNFIADDALGQLLVSRGMLDPVALEMALQAARQSGGRLGEVLVDQGVIGHKELQSLLSAQAKRKMNSAFRWKEGTYSFMSGVTRLPNAVAIDQDLLSILVAGVSLHYDMAKLEERLYTNKSAIVERAEFPELGRAELHLSEREWRLLELINGKRTLGDVIAEADLNFTRTFQVLYLMLLFGVICFAEGDRFLRVEDAVTHRARTEAAQHASGIRAAAAAADVAVESNRGNLAEVSFGHYLFHLFRTKANGQLMMERDDDQETVFLRNGIPVKVLSSRPGRLALGEMLIEHAGLSPAARDRALERARSERRLIGEVLLAERLVSPHQLFEALTSQLEAKLLALFGWTKGHYYFDEGVAPDTDLPPLNVEFTKLLLRGMREQVPAAVVQADVEPILDVPLEKTETDIDLATLFSDPREQRIVSMLDGRRTGDTLIRVTQIERMRGLRLIYSLRQLGLIATVDS